MDPEDYRQPDPHVSVPSVTLPIHEEMADAVTSHFFCSRCGRGPLFSWEMFDGRCKETCNPATDMRGNIGEPS